MTSLPLAPFLFGIFNAVEIVCGNEAFSDLGDAAHNIRQGNALTIGITLHGRLRYFDHAREARLT